MSELKKKSIHNKILGNLENHQYIPVLYVLYKLGAGHTAQASKAKVVSSFTLIYKSRIAEASDGRKFEFCFHK